MCFNDCPSEMSCDTCEIPDTSCDPCVCEFIDLRVNKNMNPYMNILFGIFIGVLTLWVFMEFWKLCRRNDLTIPDLRNINPVRVCENPTCALSAMPQDADVILLTNHPEPLCCNCIGIDLIDPNRIPLVAIRDRVISSACCACGFPARYSCIHCGQAICFSIFHNVDDRQCYDVHMWQCSQDSRLKRVSTRVLLYMYIIGRLMVNRLQQVIQYTNQVLLAFGAILLAIKAKIYQKVILAIKAKISWIAEECWVVILSVITMITQRLQEHVIQWHPVLKAKLVRIGDSGIQLLRYSTWLLKPAVTLLTLEVIQLTLELVTLAGDCGLAPGGVAAILTVVVWAINGPVSLFVSMGSLSTLALKACEGSRDAITGDPVTPKKVLERNLEKYSPLSETTAVHTRDHVVGEYKSPLLTLKRLRAIVLLILIMYVAVCVQGCTLFQDHSKAMTADSEEEPTYGNLLLTFAVIGLTITAGILITKSAQAFIALRRFVLGPNGRLLRTMVAGPSPSGDVIMATVVSDPDQADADSRNPQDPVAARPIPQAPPLPPGAWRQLEADSALRRTTSHPPVPILLTETAIPKPPPIKGSGKGKCFPGSSEQHLAGDDGIMPIPMNDSIGRVLDSQDRWYNEPSEAGSDDYSVIGDLPAHWTTDGKGNPRQKGGGPIKGPSAKGKGKSKPTANTTHWQSANARSLVLMAHSWEPKGTPFLFGFKNNCRALIPVGNYPEKNWRLHTCQCAQQPNSLYCADHQNEKGSIPHRLPDYYGFSELTRDLAQATPSQAVNYARLPYKLGIFLKENEIRQDVFSKIESIKICNLKTMCTRLGIKTLTAWRKIEYQRAILLKVGHPCFEQALAWCLEEDDKSSVMATSEDHQTATMAERSFGVNQDWYNHFQAASSFEEFQ